MHAYAFFASFIVITRLIFLAGFFSKRGAVAITGSGSSTGAGTGAGSGSGSFAAATAVFLVSVFPGNFFLTPVFSRMGAGALDFSMTF